MLQSWQSPSLLILFQSLHTLRFVSLFENQAFTLLLVFLNHSYLNLGRSESKLKAVLMAASAATGIDGLETSISTVICDVGDPESIVAMAKASKLVGFSFHILARVIVTVPVKNLSFQ
jgi:hypothetical protein